MECIQCGDELKHRDEYYRTDEGPVHVDCFHDYAWCKLVGERSISYDEELGE